MNACGKQDRGVFEAPVCVDVDAAEVRPSLEEVARHAGGERFSLRGEMLETVCALLPEVTARARPRYAFAARRVLRSEDAALELTGGLRVPFGREVVGAAPEGLAAAACTMGPGSDGLRVELGLESALDGWLLDAVLLAALDLVETRCLQDVAGAAAQGLCVGPALVPSVAGVPGGAQASLFACLGGADAGVRVDAAGTMSPLKSFGCWFPLLSGPAAAADGLHLCERCDLATCVFRRAHCGGAHAPGERSGDRVRRSDAR